MRYKENDISKIDFEDFKKGGHAVFRMIFDIFHQLLYSYIIKFCKQSEEAEELVQETFVTLFLNRSKLESREGIYPYLFTTAKRLTISNFRKKVVRTKYNDYLRQHWKEDCMATQNHLEVSELSDLLEDAIGELPKKQQAIYTLNKLDDLSYQDIADQLGVSKNTVKNHLIAATKTIKNKIQKVY